MTEEQKPSEPKSEEKDLIVSSGLLPLKVELGKVLWKWIVGGASIGSLVTILNTTELPKLALGAAAGGALTGGGAIATALLAPTLKKTKQETSCESIMKSSVLKIN